MEKNPVDEIGRRVDLLKSVLKLKNTDLARAANISSQAVADIIDGKVAHTKVNVVVAWVREYKLNYEWILEGTGTMFTEKSTKAETPTMMSILTSEIRRKDDFIAQLLDEVGKPEGVLEADSVDRYDWSLNYFDQSGASIGTPKPGTGFFG